MAKPSGNKPGGSKPTGNKPTTTRPTRRERKETRATNRGFDSVEAWTSAKKQYGYNINMKTLVDTMAAQGLNQGQPVGIGGARWYFNGADATYTGQKSDLAGGQAYDSATQDPYTINKNGKGGKGGGKGKPKPNHHQSLTEASALGNLTGPAPELSAAAFGGPEEGAFSPYAEADVATTNYTRAQGKAYGRGTGEGLMGQTESPPAAEESPTEESAVVGGGGKPKKRKTGNRQKRNVPKGKHINRSGDVVKNKGKRK